nr:extracellular solute-binding protein [Chachezhania sediminis]
MTLSAGAIPAAAESAHGIALYGEPALPEGFTHLPYANPDAPKGGRVVFGNSGSFDSLNPFVAKGRVPWQMSFWGYESLMGRSWDEPFTLYGLLAESVDTPDDRSWVEFTLRPEARFSDGTPVTVDDVIWSFETLGREGHPRYMGFASKIESIEPTGPHSVRIAFNEDNRELAMIAGLRPILQKAQWEGRSIADGGIQDIPVGTGPYVVADYDIGRSVTFRRNPDYWGRDLPFRAGSSNYDELRIEYFGDETALFEAFKAGEISAVREFNAEKWDTQYDFPAVQRGDIVKSEIPHRKPSGITGFAMNTRRPPFDDWRVREAMLQAFNFEFINDTMTGGGQKRITSYFSGSDLAMRHGPADPAVRALLDPFADTLLPGALDGYDLPVGDGTARNRGNLRQAARMLAQAGWTVDQGRLVDAEGRPFQFTVLLRQADQSMARVLDIYTQALDKLGIQVRVDRVDDAQFVQREAGLDFDMIPIRRELSLSPGNEQRFYWGSGGANAEGTRNLPGIASPAADAMIEQLVQVTTPEAFSNAVHALDRVLTTGRYVIPIWRYEVGRIAHVRQMKFGHPLPIYGDGPYFMPDFWWWEDS